MDTFCFSTNAVTSTNDINKGILFNSIGRLLRLLLVKKFNVYDNQK